MDTVTSIALAAVPSIISGIVLLMVRRSNKKSDTREANRITESILVFKNMDAIGTLGDITAKCVKKGEKPNGDMDDAIAYRSEMKHKLEDHLIKVNAEMKNG